MNNFKPLSYKTLWGITLLIFGVNFLIKIWNIFSMTMYEDEPFTLFVAQQSLGEIINVHKGDSNPFIHTMIMHFWFKIFGVHLWAGKLYSVLLSSISAGLLFKLFYKRFGLIMPLMAALLFSLSGINFFHAQEMRVYPQLILLTILSIYFFTELFFNPNRKNATFLGVVNLLLLMSHYTIFFLPLIELGILVFYIKTHKKTIKYFIISQFIAALAFTPWFFYAAINNVPKPGRSWLQTPYLVHIPWFINRMATNAMAIVNGILVLTITLLTIFRKKITFNEYRTFLFFVAIFWGTMAASFIVSKKVPIMSDRYLLFSTIGLFLSIGYGISILHLKKAYTISICALVLFIAVASLTIRPIPENWPTKMQWLKKQRINNELIVIYPWWAYRSFAYYHDYEAFKDYKQTDYILGQQNVLATDNIDHINKVMNERNCENVFIIKYKGIDNNEFLNKLDNSNYHISYKNDTLLPLVIRLTKNKL